MVEALETLKRRAPMTGVGRLVDALTTGIERGAPLADVLRAQANDGREARRRYLLETGGRREVLMLIPVVFLVMPVVVVFALLPGVVSLDLLVPYEGGPMSIQLCVWLTSRIHDERGDVPGWVLIVLMTSALVVAIWAVAKGRLVSIVQSALDTVCGDLGC